MRKLILALSISVVLSLAFGGVLVFAADASAPGAPLSALNHSFEAAISFLQKAVNGGDLQLKSVAAADILPVTPNDEISGTTGDESLDDPEDLEDPEEAKDSAYCPCDAENPHPVGEKLANKYLGEDSFETKYTEIMNLFCEGGFGFGEIDLGYRIAAAAGVDAADVFALRDTGMGWGNVLKEYKLPKPPMDPKPGLGQGNGAGNGNAFGQGINPNNGKAGGNGNAYGRTKNANKGNKGGKGKP